MKHDDLQTHAVQVGVLIRPVLSCAVLSCPALCCTLTALHCTALHCTALHCTTRSTMRALLLPLSLPLLLLPLLLLLWAGGATGSSARPRRLPEYVPDAYLVRMEAGASVETLRAAKTQVKMVHASRDDAHRARRAAVTEVEITRVMKAFEMLDATTEMVEYVKGMEGVRDVTQQKVYRANIVPGSWGQDRIDQATLPLDSNYTSNYDGTGVDIYIMDTGIDTDHTSMTPGSRNISNIYNTFGGLSNDTDGDGHGTHVAGTAGTATYGVAPGANLYGVKILDDDGSGTSGGIAAGVDWAVTYAGNTGRPAVFSLSLGGGCTSKYCSGDVLNEALNAAVDAGIVVSVAAGNDDDDACFYSPASATKVVTVASTEIDDDASWFTNYGECVDIAAPGTDIVSTCASSECGDEVSTDTKSGTSMACPHVSGVMAQYLEADPTATPAEIKEALQCDSSENQVDYSNADGAARNYLLQTAPVGALSTCDLTAGCTGNCSGKGTCDTSGAGSFCFCNVKDGYYECDANSTCRTLFMADTFGDGWDTARFNIYETSGTLVQSERVMGTESTAQVCGQPDTRYEIEVTDGDWPREIWWHLCGKSGGASFEGELYFDSDLNCEWQCDDHWVNFNISALVWADRSRFFLTDKDGTDDNLNIGWSFDDISGSPRSICLEEGTYGMTVYDATGTGINVAVGGLDVDGTDTGAEATITVSADGSTSAEDGAPDFDDEDDDNDDGATPSRSHPSALAFLASIAVAFGSLAWAMA